MDRIPSNEEFMIFLVLMELDVFQIGHAILEALIAFDSEPLLDEP